MSGGLNFGPLKDPKSLSKWTFLVKLLLTSYIKMVGITIGLVYF